VFFDIKKRDEILRAAGELDRVIKVIVIAEDISKCALIEQANK